MDTSASSNRHDQLELAAYYLWLGRGSPYGSPEIDWFEAEARLRQHSDSAEADSDNPLVAVAKAMGAAIGTVTSFVESLSALRQESDHKA